MDSQNTPGYDNAASAWGSPSHATNATSSRRASRRGDDSISSTQSNARDNRRRNDTGNRHTSGSGSSGAYVPITPMHAGDQDPTAPAELLAWKHGALFPCSCAVNPDWQCPCSCSCSCSATRDWQCPCSCRVLPVDFWKVLLLTIFLAITFFGWLMLPYIFRPGAPATTSPAPPRLT
jgi:hypothetical protein